MGLMYIKASQTADQPRPDMQTKITNGTKPSDVSLDQSVTSPQIQSAVAAASLPPAQPKNSVSFSTQNGWHMEFHHPETGEVLETYPATKATAIYQQTTRKQG